MVQNRPTIASKVFIAALGSTLSDRELEKLQTQIQIIECVPYKEFWNSENSPPGLYVVLEGKARIIDRDKSSPVSLSAGDSFGELHFFIGRDWENYAVKAGKIPPKVAYLPLSSLEELLDEHPQIRQNLEEQAQERHKLLGGSEVVPKPVGSVASVPNPPPASPAKRQIAQADFPRPSYKSTHVWRKLIKRYPFFAQQSASDCGAACLVMVGRYWGKKFSVNRLRELANVTRQGASLRGLSLAAESLGFATKPVKCTLDKLAEQALPAIAHWEGRHYVVVYQVTRDRVIIGDPAVSQLTLTHKQFKAGWTGYVLLLQPTALINDVESDSSNFWQLFELIKPHWVILLEVFIASVFIQIFGLITPLFTQLILDRVVVQRSELTLTTVGLGLLIFSIFRIAMSGLRQYLLDQTANRVDLALIVGFIRHTFRLPLSFFESRYVGDIISRVQENQKIQRFLTGEALSILLDLLTVFIYIALMWRYSWQMALLSLIIVPPFFLLALVSTPFLQKISREIFNAYAAESSYLIQGISGIRTVKSLALEQTVRWHWEELLQKSIKSQFQGQVIGNRMQVISSGIETLAQTGLLWFGAYQVIQGQLTVGQLVAFNMLLGNVIRPLQRLAVLWNEMQEVAIAIERINDVISTEPEEDL